MTDSPRTLAEAQDRLAPSPARRAAAKTRIALAGNPNSGKTTLFNAMTGARQQVGNYPGITVEKKEGLAKVGESSLHVIDLPGTYSLTAYTQEELVARAVIADERPNAVVDVLNAAILERNLYLAVQLMELGVPVILALNMMDEARAQGLSIDSRRLSELLGVPVVETVARTGQGVGELLKAALDTARDARDEWRPLDISYGPDLDPALMAMASMVEEHGLLAGRYPARWVALKYLEGDEEIRELGRAAGTVGAKLEAMASEVAAHLKATLNTYPEAIIADYRYGFITSLLKQGVVQKKPLDRIAVSDRMDRVLTHKILGPVIMIGVLYLIYLLTFSIGNHPVDWAGAFFAWLGATVEAAMPDGPLRSLLVSGVIDGVGGVLSFVPLIMIIFAIIAFLEDSGYMARIAYMLDRVFRVFGLHGCSVMPFIVSGGIAGGCALPGIMASRTLRSRREKLATMLTAPFMTCGAKLPVFILLVSVFFPERQAAAMFLITLSAWVAALLVAKALRSTVIKGPSTPFVMELPPYRLPTVRGMLIHTWERTWQYIKKAGTVILAISVLLWAAMTYPGLPDEAAQGFDTRIEAAEADLAQAEAQGASPERLEAMAGELAALEAEKSSAELRGSLAGRTGIAMENLTEHAGFDWRTNIALIGGFAAKEVIISTLGTAFSLGDVEPGEDRSLAQRLASDPSWTVVRGMALIAFIMLYAPCFASVVAIRQESGSWRWALLSIVLNTVLAFAAAMAIFQIGSALA